MFTAMHYEKTSTDENWVALCKIPLSNPPYQTEYAPKVSDTVINYQIIYNEEVVVIRHTIVYNGSTVLQGVSIDSTGTPSPNINISIQRNFGYVLDKNEGFIYPCIKLTKQYMTAIYSSDSIGIFPILPVVKTRVIENNRFGDRPSLNFGGCMNDGLYGVTTLSNVPSSMLSSFTATRYSGILFARKNSKQYMLPFMVYSNTLYFDPQDTEITGVLENNIVTFSHSTKIPMQTITFI